MMRRDKKLSLLDTLAISITAIAPTGAMALNTTAVAKFAGIHMPISFILGGLAILLIGFCFSIMANRTSGIGSVYAYNRLALNERAGFITGWVLTLVYVCGGVGAASMSTNFIEVLLGRFGINISPTIVTFGLLLVLYLVSLLGIRSASEISMLIEVVALIILAVICGVILFHGGMHGINARPFAFHAKDITRIGRGIIYVIICFAGFEESTTMTIRTKNPRRTIPFAIIGTIVIIALIFIAVSFIQVIGYGENNISKLIQSPAPLNYLAVHYVSNTMATLIDFATTISAVASFLGIMNAGSYMLFALGKKHYLNRKLGRFNQRLGCPLNALNTVVILYVLQYSIFGIPFGPKSAYANFMALGGLGFLVVYVLVCAGVANYIRKNWSKTSHAFIKGVVLPLLSVVILMFPLSSDLYPVPAFPINTYPYLIAFYIIIGLILSFRRDRL